MKLYYASGACSLASHIAIREGGMDVEASKVSFSEGGRKTEDGRDYFSVNPLGTVPALELANGEVLTEGQVILQYLAAQFPQATLGPPTDGIARWRFLETMNFLATEIHKTFGPLFANPPAEFKAKWLDKINGKFATLDRKLGAKPFLIGDSFTIADAYAFTMLNWARQSGVTYSDNLKAYFDRLKVRPGVKQALDEEGLSIP